MTQNSYKEKKPCAIDLVKKVLGGKWKMRILWALSIQTRRYNELMKLFPGITQTMLTRQLRDLEKDGFVSRQVYPEVPPKVEYSLTPMGHGFIPIINKINEWGEENLMI